MDRSKPKENEGYSAELKRLAVELVREGREAGASWSEFAEDLGVSALALGRWAKTSGRPGFAPWRSSRQRTVSTRRRGYPNEKALGYAVLANACRLLFEFVEATAWFKEADRYLPRDRQEEPLLYCQVHFLRISLLWWQEKDEAALELFNDLLPDIRKHGSKQLLARALILGGDIYDAQGHTDCALPLLMEAIQLTKHIDDRYVTLVAHFNLTHLYAISGMGSEAAMMFPEVERLHKHVSEKISIGQLRYLAGLVDKANDNLDQAEGRFIAARDHFLDCDSALYAASVSLNLALLYMELDRPAKAFTSAMSAIEPVARFGQHREAIAAFAILDEANTVQSITESEIRQALKHLERFRKAPINNFLATAGKSGPAATRV